MKITISVIPSFKAEKKLDVKEKCFIRIQTEDPAFLTRSAVTSLHKPEMFTGFEIGYADGMNNTV